jgi:hypothetical protein
MDDSVGKSYASLDEAVTAILANDSLDAETSSSTKTEEFEKLVPRFGWPAVEAAVLELLAVSDRSSHWRIAAEVLWGATLDGRTLDAPCVIAHLCFRSTAPLRQNTPSMIQVAPESAFKCVRNTHEHRQATRLH